MRVQLKGQSLRLRIDEDEMTRLRAGTTLDNATRWPDGRSSHQRVQLADADGWRRDDDGWCILLARTAMQDLAARLPTRDGLRIELAVADGTPLKVLLDVDTRDSARRRLAEKKT